MSRTLSTSEFQHKHTPWKHQRHSGLFSSISQMYVNIWKTMRGCIHLAPAMSVCVCVCERESVLQWNELPLTFTPWCRLYLQCFLWSWTVDTSRLYWAATGQSLWTGHHLVLQAEYRRAARVIVFLFLKLKHSHVGCVRVCRLLIVHTQHSYSSHSGWF